MKREKGRQKPKEKRQPEMRRKTRTFRRKRRKDRKRREIEKFYDKDIRFLWVDPGKAKANCSACFPNPSLSPIVSASVRQSAPSSTNIFFSAPSTVLIGKGLCRFLYSMRY